MRYRSRCSRFEVEPHACAVGYKLRTECQPMTPDTAEDGGCKVVGEGKRVEREGREILGRWGGLRKRHFGARVEKVWLRQGRCWGSEGKGDENSRSSTIIAPTIPLMLQRISSRKKTRSPFLASPPPPPLAQLYFGFSHLFFLPSPPARGGSVSEKLKFRYFQETPRNNISLKILF